MAHTIPALFDTYGEAEQAVRRLEAIGVPHDDISLISNNSRGEHAVGNHKDDAVGKDASAGAGAGAVLGGAGGLLAGLGALAIPGLGPIVALGWLASTAAGAAAGSLVGAAAGGLVGALTHAGVEKEDADAYAEGVRRGGTLVTVRTNDESRTAQIQQALSEGASDRTGRVDLTTRRAAYAQQGWTGFDANAPAYTADEVAAERDRYGRV